MRIAIIADIHGNRTALEAVVEDVREMSPDLVLHGGDLADGGASPGEVVDRIRELGWPGVFGNADEMLWRPESLEDFANQSSAPPEIFAAVREMADATREALGDERVAWLSGLPTRWSGAQTALVHASPKSAWKAPGAEARDDELEDIYRPLGQDTAVYGHIHRPFVRGMAGMTVANCGSVSLSYDGDPRASYLLIERTKPAIRRVEYDVGKELRLLAASRLPHADWVARTLSAARFQMP